MINFRAWLSVIVLCDPAAGQCQFIEIKVVIDPAARVNTALGTHRPESREGDPSMSEDLSTAGNGDRNVSPYLASNLVRCAR